MNREPGSPKASGGAASESLMAFVSSKEGALALLSMSLLIFQGTALSLTLRFSRCCFAPKFNIFCRIQRARPHACMYVALGIAASFRHVSALSSIKARHGGGLLSMDSS